jgi:transposase
LQIASRERLLARRRRWSDAFKAEMAARRCEVGANVSALAREIGVSPSQLFGQQFFAAASKALSRSFAKAGDGYMRKLHNGFICCV